MFSRFDAILERFKQTDGRTELLHHCCTLHDFASGRWTKTFTRSD